jgi:beta-glucosidase
MAYGLRIGAERIVDPQVAIDASADLASKSDLCIVIVGVTGEFETEGFDRKNME